MKLRFATILCAFAAMFSMASCTEEILGVGELPPLAGEVVLTDVVETSAIRLSPNYIFTLELKNASGVVLEAKLASASTALDAGTYTEASAAYATAGNFITGAEGTKLTIDGETHLVTAGTLKVALEGGSYSLSGVVKVDNGNNYSIEWAGAPLTWGDVLVATQLNTVMHTQVNQNKTITVKLADSGVEFTASQYGPQVTGGKGHYLSVDFFSEDEYLAAGTYTPSANPQQPKKGEYVIGYEVEYDYTQWGGDKGVAIYGTAWHNVDAAATPIDATEMISKGNITVSITDGVYTITVDNNEIYAQYVGEIPALLAPAVPADPWELTGDVVLIETEGLSMTMTDDTANNTMADGSALSGVTLWFVELKNADGATVAIFDLVTKAGSQSLAGEYKVVSYPDAVGEAGNGFDLRSWGLDMFGGTILTDPATGKSYSIAQDAANIKVTEDRGQTTIIVKGKTDAGVKIAAKYVFGEISEDEGGEGGSGECGCDCDACQGCTGGSGDSGDSFKGEILSLISAGEQYDSYKQANLSFATAGVEAKVEGWSATYTGTGKVVSLTIHAEKGDAGVYVPVGSYAAADGTTDPFTFQVTGGMPEYNMYWGTLMYDVVDGKATLVEVKDGTVEVECAGGNYTITMMLGGNQFRYTGPLGNLAPAN